LCIKTDILTTLTYFDIFKYPLTQTEIFFFLPNHYSQDDYTDALYDLLKGEQLFKLDDFFSLQDDYQLAIRRRKGNLSAKKLLDTADNVANFLSCFPYVRGVAVSGSLSKNYADESSDIDFFIITAKNRLWVARTFMHVFKKLTFLFKKDHLFCMNYYVDEAGLQIKEKNIYTATELATLLPLRGINAFREFFSSNYWSKDFLPNHSMRVAYTKEVKTSLLKRSVEWCLNNPVGRFLDFVFMKITASRWTGKTKKQKLNANGNVMGMDVDKHYSKPDPRSFQKKFLGVYEHNVSITLAKYEHRLKPVY
jgi:predicted nucleotidyltransferase